MARATVRFYSQEISYIHRNKKQYYNWIKEVVLHEGKSISIINVIFSTDEYLHKLNTSYLNHNTFTDVISFQYTNDPIEGDIYISIERVKENAMLHFSKFKHELARVIIHGVLHFCGYKDKTKQEKLKMTNLENKYLSLIFPED